MQTSDVVLYLYLRLLIPYALIATCISDILILIAEYISIFIMFPINGESPINTLTALLEYSCDFVKI